MGAVSSIESPSRSATGVARTVALVGKRELASMEFPLPEIGPGDLLVKVHLCGICGSDLHWWDGHWGPRYPTVLGHEFIGEVAEIGVEAAERRGLAPGDPVAVEMLLPCWDCDRCREGRYNVCDQDDRSVDESRGRQYGCNMPAQRPPTALWGGYSEYLFAPREAIVHRLPDAVPWERAVFVEPLAVACRAVARGRVRPGEAAVVVGPGLVGIMLSIAAQAAGAEPVVVTGTRDYRLALAREFGAAETINVREQDPEVELRRILDGSLADVSLEAAGTPVAQAQAARLVRRGGRAVLTGLCGPATLELDPDADLLSKEIDLLGSFLSAGGYEPAIEIAAGGEWPLERLITHRLPLDEAARAFEIIERREQSVLKVVLDPWA